MTRSAIPDGRLPRVLVLSAPSGAGKSSLARALVAAEPTLRISVSHTTRAARPGEIDGTHYHFVAQSVFESMIEQAAFLEHARVFDRYYGTSWDAVQTELSDGHDVVLDIDWQGARQVRAAFAGTASVSGSAGVGATLAAPVSVFVLPPSLDALRARLVRRGQDSVHAVARRMRDACSEIGHYREFDHVVVNDDFGRATSDLRAILHGAKAMPAADSATLVARLLAAKHSV